MADATVKKATYSPGVTQEQSMLARGLRAIGDAALSVGSGVVKTATYMKDVLTPGKIESPQDAIIRKATGDVPVPDPAPTPDTRRDMIAEQIKNAPPDRYEVYMAKQKAEDKAKAAAK